MKQVLCFIYSVTSKWSRAHALTFLNPRSTSSGQCPLSAGNVRDAQIGQTRKFGFLAYSMEMVNMGLVLGLCIRGEYGARMPKTEVKRSG